MLLAQSLHLKILLLGDAPSSVGIGRVPNTWETRVRISLGSFDQCHSLCLGKTKKKKIILGLDPDLVSLSVVFTTTLAASHIGS